MIGCFVAIIGTMNAGDVWAAQGERIDITSKVSLNISERDDFGRIRCRITGPPLRPNGKYKLSLSSESVARLVRPEVRSKTCGCVSPTIESTDEGNWKAVIKLDVSASPYQRDYAQSIIFAGISPDQAESGTPLEMELAFLFEVRRDLRVSIPKAVTSFVDGTAKIRVITQWEPRSADDDLSFQVIPKRPLLVRKGEVITREVSTSSGSSYPNERHWTLEIGDVDDQHASFLLVQARRGGGEIIFKRAVRVRRRGRLSVLTPIAVLDKQGDEFRGTLFCRVHSNEPISDTELSQLKVESNEEAGFTFNVSAKQLGSHVLRVELVASRADPFKGFPNKVVLVGPDSRVPLSVSFNEDNQ